MPENNTGVKTPMDLNEDGETTPTPAKPTPTAIPKDLIDCFPYAAMREKQRIALDFVQKAIEKGYKDIVVAAPTGIGKTAIGASFAIWKSAYYLTAQKLLQDQIENDRDTKFVKYKNHLSILKTRAEYPCPTFKNCAIGSVSRQRHKDRENDHKPKNREDDPCGGGCAYEYAKTCYLTSRIAVTNYAFAVTEHIRSGKFPVREAIVLDECHNVEKILMNMMEIAVDKTLLEKYAAGLPFPNTRFKLSSFIEWAKSELLPCVTAKLSVLVEKAEENKQALGKEIEDHTNYLHSLTYALNNVSDSWVFWSTEDDDGEFVKHQAKPVDIAPFAKSMLLELGNVRLHLSAYPSTKDVYCRALGLNPDEVAWASLSSTFPVENRKIMLCSVGSMGRRSFDSTFPSAMNVLKKIMKAHANEKGLIHCTSYDLGRKIAAALHDVDTHTVLFSDKADDRAALYEYHAKLEEPSVIVSPSMTEGFDFAGDLARWTVIAKCPYMYLGDAQVAAKMRNDPDWYGVQAASTIIQSAGRIVRSDEDWGVTYVLDSDVETLYNKAPEYFPKWFRQAIVKLRE